MATNLIIPTMGKPKTVRDVIISILSQEHPLSAKIIYNHTRKKFGLSVTYQAVHKLLKQMTGEGILKREGREYSITLEWTEKNRQFFEELCASQKQGKRPSMEQILGSDLTELKFDNLYSFYSFILNVLEKIALANDIGPFVAEFRHMYWALIGSEKEQACFRAIIERSPGSHILCNGDTPTDRMLAKHFENFGVNVKTGVKCAEKCDMMIGGGFILEIIFDEKLKKDIDKVYKETDKMEAHNFADIYEKMFDKKYEIVVKMKKIGELSDKLVEKAIGDIKTPIRFSR